MPVLRISLADYDEMACFYMRRHLTQKSTYMMHVFQIGLFEFGRLSSSSPYRPIIDISPEKLFSC